ncbi:hypothetical protein [Lactococcus lactis]|uniref:hypothetical protein n=1 Tax=Lactococcus lactis TaxID=1358 RepID=UPI0022E2BE3C|nr:hypothetical protein [Lactococcus lactis]
MKIRKIIAFALNIPFVLLMWLCFTSPFFIHNDVLNSSFGFTFITIENLSNSGPLATVLLLFVIPLLSLISCSYLTFKKGQTKNKYMIYLIMSLFSLVALQIFFVIMLIGLGNYL